MTYEEMVETAARAADTSYERMVNALAAIRTQGVMLLTIPNSMVPIWIAMHSKYRWDEEYIARNTPLMRDFMKELLAVGEIRPGEDVT